MDITVQELKEKIEKQTEFLLIDVREPHEHQEFNIGGQLIPVNSVINTIPDLEDHKENEVIVYCRSGIRSGMVQQLLKAYGFQNVRNVLGGMEAWQNAFGKQ